MKVRSISWLKITVHTAAILPIVILTLAYWAGSLGVDPVQVFTRRTGDTAIILLLCSLAATPANTIFGIRQAVKVRRALGLYAFLYAVIHFLTFTGLDYEFDLSLLLPELIQKRYIYIGLTALLILSALAFTSFRYWMVRLGKNWKRLHRLVYLAVILVFLHFTWAKKGNLFTLQGEVFWPLVALLIITLLLVVRIPAVRKRISNTRHRLSGQLARIRAALHNPEQKPYPQDQVDMPGDMAKSSDL